MSSSIADIRQRWVSAGQGHVFQWWDELSDVHKEKLLRQLRVRKYDGLILTAMKSILMQSFLQSIDVDLVNKIYTSVSTRGTGFSRSIVTTLHDDASGAHLNNFSCPSGLLRPKA
jgi:hypothetical protein